MRIYELIKLARKSFNSGEDYMKFQKLQARWIIEDLSRIVEFKGKTVLDVGCGYGGYSLELAKVAKIVVALDLNIVKKLSTTKNIIQVRADATNLPFKDNTFDFVFCSSLIEHVQNQDKFISELYRLTKPNGFCYLSFPPFYSPVGGHQFKPFHLLGEKIAIALYRRLKNIEVESFGKSFGNWGLYKTTIRKIKKLIKSKNPEFTFKF